MRKLFYRPVDPWVVTQRFGENNVCIDNATGKRVISCDGRKPPAGYRSVYSLMRGHNALDVAAKRWQPIYAAADGTVDEVETEESRGLGVGVRHDFGADGLWKTRYWHMVALDVHKGDKVKTGELIGYADSTGLSTNDHVHFELKPLLPSGKNKFQDNGYFGAVDPTPWMHDSFALKFSLLTQLRELAAKLLDMLSDRVRRR